MPKSKKRKKSALPSSPNKLHSRKTASDSLQHCINAGVQAFQAGDLVQAENKCREALQIDQDCAIAYSLLGIISLNHGLPDTAEPFFRMAISIDPGISDYHYNLALALLARDSCDEAVSSVRKALSIQPNHAGAWNTLGQLLLHNGDLVESVEALKRAIACQETMGEAWVNLCGAYQELNDHAKAQKAGEKGCTLCPDIPQAHYNLARSYDGEHKWHEAILAYNKTLELDPTFLKALVNLSRCHSKNGNSIEGEKFARQALELAPDDAEAHNNLGTALLGQGLYEEAIASFYRSTAIDFESPEAHNNLGHALLTLERFDEGWPEYEYGFLTGDRGPLTQTPAPIWNGEPLLGKRIHIYGEQGIGEQVMFATMFEDLKYAGAHIVFECEERLVPLFTRSMPWMTVVPIRDEPHPSLIDGSIDYRISSGSLAQWLRTSADKFSPRKEMLIPDPDLTNEYHQRYRKLGKGLIVGISWKSNSPNHANQKSIPIEQWQPVFATQGCHFVSLQYGEISEDIKQARAALGVDIYVDQSVSAMNSLEQSAAQASAVDLVISISNATVHLSGACSRPTWVLLGEKPLWHWFLKREHSLWYDSLELLRQQVEGNWAPLMEQVAHKLTSYSIEKAG